MLERNAVLFIVLQPPVLRADDNTTSLGQHGSQRLVRLTSEVWLSIRQFLPGDCVEPSFSDSRRWLRIVSDVLGSQIRVAGGTLLRSTVLHRSRSCLMLIILLCLPKAGGIFQFAGAQVVTSIARMVAWRLDQPTKS